MAEEGLKRTQNDLIHIGCPIPFNIEEFLDKLDALMEAAYKNVENIREMVAEVVTTYHEAWIAGWRIRPDEAVAAQPTTQASSLLLRLP